jgi:hypothetical protein
MAGILSAQLFDALPETRGNASRETKIAGNLSAEPPDT